MNERSMASRIANVAILQRFAYEAQGPFEKMVGYILTNQLGVTDAPEEFFKGVKEQFDRELAEEGLEEDLKDPSNYPALQRSIQGVGQDMGLWK